MKVKANVFVCSKPLQYFNVRNLIHNKNRVNILIIENRFNNADKFFKNIVQYDNCWNKVFFTNNRFQVFNICFLKYTVENFYYYLDWLLIPGLLLYALPAKNIFIYEEGVGSYRTDIFNNTSNLRKRIRRMLRISEYPGFHPKIKGIYIYRPAVYNEIFKSYNNKPAVLSFNSSFKTMITENTSLGIKLFNYDNTASVLNLKNKRICLYITSWPLYEAFFSVIDLTKYEYCIIKPHPHIRNLSFLENKNERNIIVIKFLLAELLISILVNNNNVIDIYHHNSSSLMYVEKSANINLIKNL